ncbi:MAG: ATP-binding protein [Deltaproteobacteria bacterium]|nr:ATP-binding protein [Deltaproteobacteria bacterium]
MIIVVTGLPGVGKTRFLRRLVKGELFYLIEIDKIKYRMLEQKRFLLSTSCRQHYNPPRYWKKEDIIGNHEKMMAHYKDMGRCLNEYLIPALAYIKKSGNWIVEISPFLLEYIEMEGDVFWFYTSRTSHETNIATRIRSDVIDAGKIMALYNYHFNFIESQVNRLISKRVDIKNKKNAEHFIDTIQHKISL